MDEQRIKQLRKWAAARRDWAASALLDECLDEIEKLQAAFDALYVAYSDLRWDGGSA